jgi:hypothetical protein
MKNWIKSLFFRDINTIKGDIAVAVLELENLINIQNRLKGTNGIPYYHLIDHDELITKSTKRLVKILLERERLGGKNSNSDLSKLLQAVLKNELPTFLTELRKGPVKNGVINSNISKVVFNPN